MSKYERKYELLACVSIIQREGSMRASEYREYGTSCWHVSASYSARDTDRRADAPPLPEVESGAPASTSC